MLQTAPSCLPQPACAVHPLGLQRTEELFASPALLNDLDQAGFQLFDRRHMIGKYAHLSRFGRYVDLDTDWGFGVSLDYLAGSFRYEANPYTSVDL